MARKTAAPARATADTEREESDADVYDLLARFLDELDTLDGLDAVATAATGSIAASTAECCLVAAAANTAPSSVSRAPVKRKRNRPAAAVNTSWKRQKEEIASLRGGVETLQTQLELLQQWKTQQRQRKQQPDARESSDVSSAPSGARDGEAQRSTRRLLALKERVTRELRARQQAKLENAKLRKLAEDARLMTRSIEDVFAKHPSPSMTDLVDVCPALRVVNAVDTQVFRDLERCLDARYAGLGLEHGGCGRCLDGSAGKIPDNLRAIDVLAKSEEDSSLLFNNSRVVPFSVQLINDVVWGDKEMAMLQTKDSAIKIVQRSESSLFLTKQYTIRDAEDNEVVVSLQSVFRRYVDTNRIFMAWESVGEWPSSFRTDEGSESKFAIREHGWGSVLPFPDSGDRSPVSAFRVSIIVAPDVMGDSREELRQRAQAQVLLDNVVPTHRLAFAARMQQLENLLLDHSIKAA